MQQKEARRQTPREIAALSLASSRLVYFFRFLPLRFFLPAPCSVFVFPFVGVVASGSSSRVYFSRCLPPRLFLLRRCVDLSLLCLWASLFGCPFAPERGEVTWMGLPQRAAWPPPRGGPREVFCLLGEMRRWGEDHKMAKLPRGATRAVFRNCAQTGPNWASSQPATSNV